MSGSYALLHATEFSVVGRYRLIGVIGHGGMADVHLALAEGPIGVRKVAVVKQLRPGHRHDRELRSMFIDEARVAARLSHPNVVQTYEVGVDDGAPFIAMEFLDGQPLHRVIRHLQPSGGWSLAAHLRVIAELLGALHYTHELCDFDGRPLQIVHRDVTPHNVFITYDGVTKLVDFGIAKGLDSEVHTRVGVFKGKLPYMAPEQVRGDAVDRRADLFAVGVILWEALAGRRMWGALPELELMRRLDAGELPALPHRDRIDPVLAELCERALAVDPERRPATAEAFRRELEAAMRGLDVPSAERLGSAVALAFDATRRDLRELIERAIAASEPTGPLPAASLPSVEPQDETRVLTHPGLVARSLISGRVPAAEVESTRDHRRPRSWVPFAITALVAGAVTGALAQRPAPATASEHASPSPAIVGSRCAGADGPIVELTGELDGDARLTCDRRYLLRFNTFVRPGATLTIEPGTTVLGDPRTRGTLVIQPGARILAEGTADAPIVFTSANEPDRRQPGDWGGVILLGRAPVHLPDREGRSLEGNVEGLLDGGRFGGDAIDDDSGVLRYARIEYAGIELAPNNETNGLTLAGVGAATRIDHVEVLHAADDCFEFFGGTVAAHHLVCEDPGDDGIDWDLGYRGRLEFVVVRGTARSQHGIEADGDPRGELGAGVGHPRLAHVTLCGPGGGDSERYGVLLRNKARAHFERSMFDGFDAAIDLRGSSADARIESSVFGPTAPVGVAERTTGKAPYDDDDDGRDEQTRVMAPGHDNRIDASATELCRRAKPSPTLATDDDYVGAFRDADDDWDVGWVVWAPPP